ncbi:hypothetical protein MKX03_036407 [Papaver bracteatum]|nr:hypothetical protein MKX03_036407 [Papaver bracteatum]
MSTSKQVGSAERLWKSCANEALYFWYSPLFVHIASGSLDDKELYEYVANYAHLLNSFLEVYKLAADQCEDDSGKAAFLGWSKNVKQELERHNSIVEQKRGLDPTRETTLHTATAKYKEFLLATASGDIQGGLDMLKIDGNAFGYADGVFTGEVTRQEHQSVTATPECFEDMVQENEKFILTLSELQLATNSFYKANLLGEGSAGSFCKAQFTDGQIFAARVVDTVALSLHEEHFFNIIQNVACLRHPNIITFTGYCLENGQLVRLNIALGISLALE